MTHLRPFRFGVQIARAESAAEWQDKARKVEALGYSTLAMPDHFGDQFAWGPALTMVAAVTTTLRVCPFVLANDFRHPALVAQEAATLDVLSDGRLELGLGAGWLGSDYTKPGIPFDSPGVRVSRFQESVRVIKGLFSGEPVTHHGDHYQITELAGRPVPIQKPHPPIVLGGGGKRVLSFAAREADVVGLLSRSRADGSGFGVHDSTAAATDEKIGWIREAAGDRWDRIELNILLQHLTMTDRTSERDAAYDELAERWEQTPETIASTPAVLIGSVDEIVEALIARRERWGISYVVIRAADIERFAPVVARLGT